MSRRTHGLLAGLLLVAPLAACTDNGSDAGPSDAPGGTGKISVISTADECTLSETSAPAGNVVFSVKNEGSKVTEFYLLRKGGKEVVGEVENIGPGTSRKMSVDITAGTYVAQCKPGMIGDGIDVSFKATGSGGTPQAKADRTISFDAMDFGYEELDLAGIAKGDTVRFAMENSGDQPHEFEVLDPQGVAVGEVASVPSGDAGAATITFKAPGTYSYQCILVDKETGKKHTMLGMKGTFEVAAS